LLRAVSPVRWEVRAGGRWVATCRGRFGMYVPPLLEALGRAELTHETRNNKVHALA
jgi:hypothetical protein